MPIHSILINRRETRKSKKEKKIETLLVIDQVQGNKRGISYKKISTCIQSAAEDEDDAEDAVSYEEQYCVHSLNVSKGDFRTIGIIWW